MSRYSYTFNRDSIPNETYHYYSREELELMTTYQLREICRQERLINGLLAPFEKDELIRQILRFRGRADNLFIAEPSKDGISRLEELLHTAKLDLRASTIQGCAKLIAYHNIAIEYFDHVTIGYAKELADTNALLVSGNKICAIFHIRFYKSEPDKLFITKSANLDCTESNIKNYTLYCMDKNQSDLLYHVYQNDTSIVPDHLTFQTVPVLDFEVRDLLHSRSPLAIDFGSSNTTAGAYLDNGYFEQLRGDPIIQRLHCDGINHVTFLDVEHDDTPVPVIPSAVAVVSVNGDYIKYAFGYDANRLFHMSYIDEGFCVFYDLKRWIGDAERLEELVDRKGHRNFVPRKEIIKAYLEYIISSSEQRFKCHFDTIHISAPVKQKPLFIELFRKLLPQYQLVEETMIDEGVAVLYNTISDLIEQKRYMDGQVYRALIIDCGGGTTDLSSCHFKIQNNRVAYKIDITTAYENGNTDFGGNNLTYRIMQLLKIALASFLVSETQTDFHSLIASFEGDLFRNVDEYGLAKVYSLLDQCYQNVEAIIPTRFKDYEHRSRADYYAVKNNFYFLFEVAERIKKAFYEKNDLLRLAVSSTQVNEIATECLLVDKWKLSIQKNGVLSVLKDIPTVYLSIYDLNLLLRADIYGIIKQFLEGPYDSGELDSYQILKLTGQSCKINIFRDALKEFIPGKIIAPSKNRGESEYELKLVCLDGAIKYLKDQKYGYADVKIHHEQAAFPYKITAFTHTGEEVILIQSLDREKIRGFISRNMVDLTLKIYLKDLEGKTRYVYNCACKPEDFEEKQPEQIVARYIGQIRQDDLDDIVNHELKFFVFADENSWGFHVVPVLRKENQLHLGPEQFFRFETEAWITNFFDGTK